MPKKNWPSVILQLMELLLCNQIMLAKLLGCDVREVKRWIAGDHSPNLTYQSLMAELFYKRTGDYGPFAIDARSRSPAAALPGQIEFKFGGEADGKIIL